MFVQDWMHTQDYLFVCNLRAQWTKHQLREFSISIHLIESDIINWICQDCSCLSHCSQSYIMSHISKLGIAHSTMSYIETEQSFSASLLIYHTMILDRLFIQEIALKKIYQIIPLSLSNKSILHHCYPGIWEIKKQDGNWVWNRLQWFISDCWFVE